NNVWTAVEAGAPVGIGSSGLTPGDHAGLDRPARGPGGGGSAAGYFSIMAALFRPPRSIAARHPQLPAVIRHASGDQRDVPSGASRELAEALAQVREPALTVALADLHGPAEARGTEVAGTRIHSVRLPSFVVSTEVIFGGPGERMIMRHDPGLTAAPYVT